MVIGSGPTCCPRSSPRSSANPSVSAFPVTVSLSVCGLPYAHVHWQKKRGFVVWVWVHVLWAARRACSPSRSLSRPGASVTPFSGHFGPQSHGRQQNAERTGGEAAQNGLFRHLQKVEVLQVRAAPDQRQALGAVEQDAYVERRNFVRDAIKDTARVLIAQAALDSRQQPDAKSIGGGLGRRRWTGG